MDEEITFIDKVREDLILLDLPGDTRDEVLRNIASVYMEKGIAKPTFYDALLERERDYPTGLPIGNINVAIPHTYPEHINEIAVGIAIPKNPVVFMEMGGDDREVVCSVVVCLALKKMDDNVRMLPSLMDFFAVEDNLKLLLACRTPAEVMDILQKKVNGHD